MRLRLSSWTSASAPKAAAKSRACRWWRASTTARSPRAACGMTFRRRTSAIPEAKGQTYQLTSEQYAVNQVTQYVDKLGAANHSRRRELDLLGFDQRGPRGHGSSARQRRGGRRAAAQGSVLRLPDDVPRRTAGTHHRPLDLSGKNKEDCLRSLQRRGGGVVRQWQVARARQRFRKYLFTFPDVAWEAGEIKGGGLQRRQSKLPRRASGRRVPLLPCG